MAASAAEHAARASEDEQNAGRALDRQQSAQRWLAEARRAEADAAAAALRAPEQEPAPVRPETRACTRKTVAAALCCPAYMACAPLGAPACDTCGGRLALLRAGTCGLPFCFFAAYAALVAAVCCLQCDCCERAREQRVAVAAALTCRAWGDELSGDDPSCVTWALHGEAGPCLADW